MVDIEGILKEVVVKVMGHASSSAGNNKNNAHFVIYEARNILQ
jgi:hypothetical protein